MKIQNISQLLLMMVKNVDYLHNCTIKNVSDKQKIFLQQLFKGFSENYATQFMCNFQFPPKKFDYHD